MATVKGVRMTADERAGKKTWYCQNDGSELEEKQTMDPTGSTKCPTCGASWWAALPPSADDVEERMAGIKAQEKRAADAMKAAKK
jgi:hypothetical protein